MKTFNQFDGELLRSGILTPEEEERYQATKCAFCGRTVYAPIKGEIFRTSGDEVIVEELLFCNDEHHAYYQMGREG